MLLTHKKTSEYYPEYQLSSKFQFYHINVLRYSLSFIIIQRSVYIPKIAIKMRLLPQDSLPPNVFSTILLRLFLHNVEGKCKRFDIFHTPIILDFAEDKFINIYLISYDSLCYIHHVSTDHILVLSFRKNIFLCNS